MHEDAYRQLKAKDKISWDGETEATSLFNHEINQAISRIWTGNKFKGSEFLLTAWITTVPMLEDEISQAGFEIVESVVDPQGKCKGTFCGWLKKL